MKILWALRPNLTPVFRLGEAAWPFSGSVDHDTVLSRVIAGAYSEGHPAIQPLRNSFIYLVRCLGRLDQSSVSKPNSASIYFSSTRYFSAQAISRGRPKKSPAESSPLRRFLIDRSGQSRVTVSSTHSALTVETASRPQSATAVVIPMYRFVILFTLSAAALAAANFSAGRARGSSSVDRKGRPL